MTLADARTPTDALVTMHLVVAPPKVRRAVARPPAWPCEGLTRVAPPAQQQGKKAPKEKAPVADGVAHPASSGCCVVS
jgi:hypothetical protein